MSATQAEVYDEAIRILQVQGWTNGRNGNPKVAPLNSGGPMCVGYALLQAQHNLGACLGTLDPLIEEIKGDNIVYWNDRQDDVKVVLDTLERAKGRIRE